MKRRLGHLISDKTFDNVDLKILQDLLSDARANFSDIAKECDISKNAIWNRFKKMQSDGIVNGATVQINFKSLGYDCVATFLLQVEPDKVDEVSKILENIPDAFGPVATFSRYNLRVILPLREIHDLERMRETLRRNKSLREVAYSIWTRIWFLPENLSLLRPANGKNVSCSLDLAKHPSNPENTCPDETDLLLIRELAKDSQVSFNQIASKIGVSTDTVVRRYHKLKSVGVITPRIQMDASKIGYEALMLFHIRYSAKSFSDAIIKEIAQIPDIFYIFDSEGENKLGAMLIAKNVNEIFKTENAISRIGGVERIDSNLLPIGREWPAPRTYVSN